MAEDQAVPIAFRTLCVPSPMAGDVLALIGLAVEGEQPPAEIGDCLKTVGDILGHRVPNATSRVPAKLIARAALGRLFTLVRGLESELELRMLNILADADVALDFVNGREIGVRYPDRLSGDQWGVAKPDFYHRRARLAIFCDSNEHHGSRQARSRDNGVSSALLLRGITPLRFTGDQILNQPMIVGRVVLEHLKVIKPRTRSVKPRSDAA